MTETKTKHTVNLVVHGVPVDPVRSNTWVVPYRSPLGSSACPFLALPSPRLSFARRSFCEATVLFFSARRAYR